LDHFKGSIRSRSEQKEDVKIRTCRAAIWADWWLPAALWIISLLPITNANITI